jgi:hypothetical protein
VNQAEESAFAITADAIVAEPRDSKRFVQLATPDIPDLVKEAIIDALVNNSDRPDDEMVEAIIETLRANKEPDVRAAASILEWARSNAAYHRQGTSP